MDLIEFTQKVSRRIFGWPYFGFRAEYYGREGVEPDPIREAQTRWGLRLGTRLFAQRYPGVPGRIHMHEPMMQDDQPESVAHYLKVGQSAMANIEATLAEAGLEWGDIERCLDMACGYGRVLRHLAGRMPGERITACEVTAEAITFCAEEFGARPLLSRYDLEAMSFPETYDLIWVGSLFTHLPPREGIEFMQKLAGTLRAGGLLIFSTQGPTCLEHIPFYGFMFEDKEAEFRRQLEAEGAAYLPYYEHTPGYGITLYDPETVRTAMAERWGESLRLVRYAERGWDDHQDVWGFARVNRAG